MADQPYQFGDVVDGYRWTITGWEPVEPAERTVGVPRLLEARYAATQQAQARQLTQTLEAEAPLVVEGAPALLDETVEPAASAVPEPPAAPASVADAPVAEAAAAHLQPAAAREQEPEQSHSLEELLGGGRRVVAAPDLAIEFDADPVEDEQGDVQPVGVDAALDETADIASLPDEPVGAVSAVDDPVAIGALVEALADEPVEIAEQVDPADAVVAIEPWPTAEPWDGAVPDGAALDREADPVAAEPEPYDARPAGMRAWYGLGIEPIEEPEPEPSPFVAAPVDDDAPFAAALALGARALAETYQPSDIEIAAGAAARQPVQTWSAPAWEPIDEWSAADASAAPPEPLDAHDLTYGSASLPEPSAPAPEPEPRVVSPSQPPPAGWYPGSG